MGRAQPPGRRPRHEGLRKGASIFGFARGQGYRHSRSARSRSGKALGDKGPLQAVLLREMLERREGSAANGARGEIGSGRRCRCS
jgi:hypothetical protein